MLQIAFQYTVVVPPEELPNSGLISTSRSKHSLKRRLRIRTLQYGTSQNINELYDSVDPEVILSILVHKVILASLEQGVREGRMLLHDWLVILTAQYNDAYKLVQYKNGSSITAQIDVAFSQCPQLQPLPRLVFALLRNPLLRFHEEGVHPDYRIYLQCLFSALEPSSLHRAVYPVLTSYATPDKQAYPRHSLSRAALITSGSPIFFIDAFTTLIVFYSSTADPTLPFPPPHDCLLRTTINKLKQERSITPKLIFIRGGQDDSTAFENYLIEEQDVDGSGLTSVMGFVSFLENITQSVLEMKSQMASPGFTDVFAALVAVVNTKFPEVGELLLRRIVLQLKRAYKRNDKPQLLAAVKFIAHLVNQQVAHEIIALELLTLLLENPTDDSVEVAVGFITECGSILQDLSPKGLHGIFERFRGILHEGEIDKRVQFLIEGLFAIRKAKFQGYPAVRPELDLVEQEDQLTHELSLREEIDAEIALDIFKLDPQFLESEKRYEELKKTILGEESEDEEGSDAGSEDEDEDDDEDDDDDEEEEEQMKIKDETETNLVNLRRTIYLTIMSSVDFEEAGHKLLKIKLEPGQEMELCIMLLECCSQERTYLRYYGLLGQRFCMINKVHQENFEKCFVQQYSMIHRLETNKLRNVAKFFAHLLGTFALPWHVLAYIRLTEEDTTSSSRIFIKILFQELSEHLGIRLLNERLTDPTMQDSFESIFPKDNPKNTRFAINFFTSIGLGGITENLREYLKNMPRLIMQQQKPVAESDEESGSSGSSASDTGSSDSESESKSDSDSSSSGSERDERRRKRKRRD